MKKLLLPIMCCIAALVYLSSCTLMDTEIPQDFDETNLYGKWLENNSGTLYYIYNADGTGKTWDVADDVTEAEAQPFTWTLTHDDFLHIYIGEMGEEVPKEYTMKVLTSIALQYTDGYKTYSFTKK